MAGTRVPCSSPPPPGPVSPVAVPVLVPVGAAPVPVGVAPLAVVAEAVVEAVLGVDALSCVIGPGTLVVKVAGIVSPPPQAAAPSAAPTPAAPARAAATTRRTSKA
jgi:hypothetical protein